MKTNRLFLLIALAGVLAVVTFSCEDNEPEVVSNSGGANAIQSPLKGGRSSRTSESNYTFTGSEGGAISLDVARAWADHYRTNNPGDTEGHFFGQEIIHQILTESGCVGIRIYYALDDEGNKQLIIVGVDQDGNDLLPSTPNAVQVGENIIADMSYPCPTYCPGLGI